MTSNPYRIYTSDGEYVVTTDNPAQAIRGTLADMFQLWARLDAFVRTQEANGPLPASHQVIQQMGIGLDEEYIDTVTAQELAEAEGRPIGARTLLYNLNHGNVPGAVKTGGRWTLSRNQFLQWIRMRS
jgi:hypothetical protein